MPKNIENTAPADIDALLEGVRARFIQAQKEVSLSRVSTNFSSIDEVGSRIREERKRQGLTLNDLCDLSGVAYVTLNKIEQGHPSVRLDSLKTVTDALGMTLWVG